MSKVLPKQRKSGNEQWATIEKSSVLSGDQTSYCLNSSAVVGHVPLYPISEPFAGCHQPNNYRITGLITLSVCLRVYPCMQVHVHA